MKHLWVLLLVPSFAGCELWLDVDAPQCKTDQTCVGLLGRAYTCGANGVCAKATAADAGPDAHVSHLPERWACAANPVKEFIPDPDKQVKIRMDVVDLATLHVPDGLSAMACSAGDVDCANAIVSDQHPGPDGFFEFNMPYGFEGFMKFTAPNLVTALSYSNRAYLESLTTSGPAMSSPSSVKDVALHSGRDIDESAGLAFLEVRDCNDKAGDGVSFDDVGDQTPFYFDGALPARSGITATTISNQLAANREARAVGGFSNLPPGYVAFQARLASTGDPIARITVQIRPEHITYVRLYAGY